jgi:hypothetical protein
MYEGQFKIGDHIPAEKAAYESHFDREDLVVLYMDDDRGYGIGPEGNSAENHHDSTDGWLWYTDSEVETK